ncbi:MAG TPA: hypothetical protein VGJ39_15595 [Vicinamibacterales bacterium]|jgi:hypothetical protein
MALRYRLLGALIGAGILLSSARPVLGDELASPQRQSIPAALDRDDGSITVTGCLLLGSYGDFTLSKTLSPRGFIRNSVAWKLEDNKQLLAHVLEKVEVTGTMLPMPDVPHAVGTTGSDRPAERGDASEYRIRVKTIKRIGDCS